MKKTLFLIFVIASIQLSAQALNVPDYTLSGIQTEIEITGISPGVEEIILRITGDEDLTYRAKVDQSQVKLKVEIPNSGRYVISISELGLQTEVRVIPGWFSIIPPLLAIALALFLREVVTSLLAGIFIGAIFMYDFNPAVAFLRMIDTIMLNSLADKDHITIIVFTLLFGAVIGVIAKNGGTIGISNIVIKFAKDARSGLISSWLMGLFIFFDDYANSLIIGNMMRPITDKLRISREKLAYIVDSTAAPVASLVIVSSWIGFEVGLISEGLNVIGSDQSAYEVFLLTIPYRFYPIAALAFVFLTSYLKRDFGPMYKAEMRAREKGILYENLSAVEETSDIKSKFETVNAKWWNGVIPILVLIIGTVAGLIFTGIDKLEQQGIVNYGIRQIISNSDSFSSLLWASFSATLIAVVMSVSQKLLSLSKAIAALSKGLQSMIFACVILVLAWSISYVTTELHTADYLISILSDAVDPRFMPVIVFIICALISFSTGTSWGTMAIVMPIVIPLASKISINFGLDPQTTNLILVGVVSSVLAGSVFGDHCSPIADTTILSSIASRCNHIDHVKTQMPYALTVGLFSMFLGDLLTAFGLNPFIAIVLIITSLITVLFIFGKKVPNYILQDTE